MLFQKCFINQNHPNTNIKYYHGWILNEKNGFGIEYTLEDTKLYEGQWKNNEKSLKVFYMMKMKKLFLWVLF